jgi:predicted hotdog family 3-hydroxylacyl-ACP dehydratase
MRIEDFKNYPIEALLPHARPMLLLDRVTDATEEVFECEVTLREDSEFCVDGRVGAWIGLEYMAQTVAAFAGAEGLRQGQGIRVGLLLGTRRFTARVPHFEVGATLRARAVKTLIDPNGISVVDCTLLDHPSGEELARAVLTVFQVPSLEAFFGELNR